MLLLFVFAMLQLLNLLPCCFFFLNVSDFTGG